MNENLNARKSLGIVKWFGDTSSGKTKNYGFITLLVSRQDGISEGDVHLSISNVLRRSRKPEEDDFIVFYIKKTWRGKDALNAVVLDDSEVAGQLDLSDTRELVQVIGALNILKNIEPNFKEKVLDAFNKHFYKFTDDEICDCVDKLYNSPQEIVKVLAEKFDGSKVKELIKNCAEKNPRDWADFIFSSDKNFPTELIVKLFPYAKVENIFTAFKKYCGQFTDDEIFTCTEKISSSLLKEVAYSIKINRPNDWQDIFSMCIDKSLSKNAWLDLLLDDFATFKQVKLSATTRILMMYAAAKEDKISQTLVDEFEKSLKRLSPGTLRTRLVYAYFRACYEKSLSHEEKSREYLVKAIEYLGEIFKNFSENPDIEKLRSFTPAKLGANIFPPCPNSDADKKIANNGVIKCIFCESTHWNKEIKNPETGEKEKISDTYCPRLRGSGLHCVRNTPNLYLSSDQWSIVELSGKFGLNLEQKYFADMCGELNRLYELGERMLCRSCGKVMRSDNNYATWKDVPAIESLICKTPYNEIPHFAIFKSTVFSCRNSECENFDIKVYLNHCWHCDEIIDSRDSPLNISTGKYRYGYYSCMNCGAGWQDPEYRCINCKDTNFKIQQDKGKFYAVCETCGKETELQCLLCGSQDIQVLEKENGTFINCKTCSKETLIYQRYLIPPGNICPNCTKCPRCGHTFLELVPTDGEILFKCKSCRHIFYATQLLKRKGLTKQYKCSDPNCGHEVTVEFKRLKDYLEYYQFKKVPFAVDVKDTADDAEIYSSERHSAVNDDFVEDFVEDFDLVSDKVPF